MGANLTIQNPNAIVSTSGIATELNLTGPFNVVYYTFDDLDTTPDISAGTFFRTANTGATLIEDFDGNTDCIIQVRSGDGNTTLVHDPAKLNLKAGMSIAFPAGDSKWFNEDGGVWYEMTNP